MSPQKRTYYEASNRDAFDQYDDPMGRFDFVLTKDEKLNHTYSPTRNQTFRETRVITGSGNDGYYDPLATTSFTRTQVIPPGNNYQWTESGKRYGDNFTLRTDPSNPNSQRLLQNSMKYARGAPYQATNHYSFGRNNGASIPELTHRIDNHITVMEDLLHGQERDINYLLGMSPARKPYNATTASKYLNRSQDLASSRFANTAPTKYQGPADYDVVYTDAELRARVLTDYPELRKKDLEFKGLNNEKEINEGMLKISENLLSEAKDALSKVKSVGNSYKKTAPEKGDGSAIRKELVNMEKHRLKTDYQVDLGATGSSPNARPAPRSVSPIKSSVLTNPVSSNVKVTTTSSPYTNTQTTKIEVNTSKIAPPTTFGRDTSPQPGLTSSRFENKYQNVSAPAPPPMPNISIPNLPPGSTFTMKTTTTTEKVEPAPYQPYVSKYAQPPKPAEESNTVITRVERTSNVSTSSRPVPPPPVPEVVKSTYVSPYSRVERTSVTPGPETSVQKTTTTTTNYGGPLGNSSYVNRTSVVKTETKDGPGGYGSVTSREEVHNIHGTDTTDYRKKYF
jgi:hypothetical protein